MAPISLRALFSKLMVYMSETPEFLRCCYFLIYCRLYKLINTCIFIECIFSLYYSFLGLIFRDKKRLQWKTHWQSPVCRVILRRRYFMNRSKSSLSGGISSLALALLIFIDIRTGTVCSCFGVYAYVVWYFELFLEVVLSLNTFVALSLYAWSLISKPMPISPVQQKLFRISENDPGFEVKQKNESASEVVHQDHIEFTSWRGSGDSISSALSVTPLNYSLNSWTSSISPGSAGLDTSSSSWSFYRPSSPIGYTSTPKSTNTNKLSLRLLDHSDYIESPYERPIKNRRQLNEFLKVHEEEENKLKSMSFEDSKSFITNMATVESSLVSVLSKCRYRRSCRLPRNETTEDDSSEIHCGDTVLNKLKITDKMLTVWCERIRKWICQTILVKLVQEIDDINSTLSQIGLPEFQIGTVSLFALHQIAVTKSQHLPTLSAVLPYVDMHLNQEYLIRRLKELAHGGCMGDFKWNSGGTHEDKQWCDDLPSDSAVIIHVLCCYLDAHLPPEPHFPEGKPFSSKYLKKVPEKPVLSKDLHYIYQSNLNPPQFKVVLGEDSYTLPKGRNNLFCALVIFLHYLKTKECGMLGRVNLGRSGLNILWVLD